MTTLYAAVRAAATQLADAGVESAHADAVALAAHVLGVSRSEVHRLMALGAESPDRLADLVAERARRVPLQHLTGQAGFRRLELSVGPGVFVPRPETEVVAGLAIAAARSLASGRSASGRSASGGSASGRSVSGGSASGRSVSDRPSAVVVDLCTGSGAIALSVKDELPAARVHAVELSELAYAWAVRNRDDLGLDVDIRLGDATSAFPELEGGVDVVVSNPPYIPAGAVPNDPEVREHDPELALYGGSDDGLRIPLAMAVSAARLLRPGGRLVMEHADVQGELIVAALAATGSWSGIEDHLDLAGKPRAVTADRG